MSSFEAAWDYVNGVFNQVAMTIQASLPDTETIIEHHESTSFPFIGILTVKPDVSNEDSWIVYEVEILQRDGFHFLDADIIFADGEVIADRPRLGLGPGPIGEDLLQENLNEVSDFFESQLPNVLRIARERAAHR